MQLAVQSKVVLKAQRGVSYRQEHKQLVIQMFLVKGSYPHPLNLFFKLDKEFSTSFDELLIALTFSKLRGICLDAVKPNQKNKRC